MRKFLQTKPSLRGIIFLKRHKKSLKFPAFSLHLKKASPNFWGSLLLYRLPLWLPPLGEAVTVGD